MQIETFNQLFKTQNPQGNAYIPEKMGKRVNAVSVTFQPDGKAYTYKGTILQVAERLELIPEIDVNVESQKAITELRLTGTATAPSHCIDTINYYLNIPGKAADEIDRTTNEYGQTIATFKVNDNPWA